MHCTLSLHRVPPDFNLSAERNLTNKNGFILRPLYALNAYFPNSRIRSINLGQFVASLGGDNVD